jgi:hypothetical protein
VQPEAKQQEVILAFFDVLGFANRVANGGAPALYRKYRLLVERLRRLRSTTYSQWLPRAPEFIDGAGRFDVGGLAEKLKSGRPVEWVPAATIVSGDDMSTLHFSDTIMLWSKDSLLTNGEFIDMAIDFFCQALRMEIPLRGAIAVGDLIHDEDRSIVIGGALVEAAKAESAQAWCGIGLGPSLRGRTIIAPNDRVLSFSGHIKAGREADVLTTSLDWTWHWRTRHPELSLDSVAAVFGNHPYWHTTLEFARISEARDHLGHLPIFDLEVDR